jgi:hypothetical protein
MREFLNFASESSCAEVDAGVVTEATECLDRTLSFYTRRSEAGEVELEGRR